MFLMVVIIWINFNNIHTVEGFVSVLAINAHTTNSDEHGTLSVLLRFCSAGNKIKFSVLFVYFNNILRNTGGPCNSRFFGGRNNPWIVKSVNYEVWFSTKNHKMGETPFPKSTFWAFFWQRIMLDVSKYILHCLFKSL